MEKLLVINSRGEEEVFSRKKIYRSCRRAGASRDLAKNIAQEIEEKAFPGINTSEIFSLVTKLLSKKSSGSLMRFSLKEAMRKMGPAGFDFEKYVGQIFARQGYEVEVNKNIPGYCVSSYEIDFLAEKKNFIYIGECKYHYLPGKRVDLKIGLSNYARFLDIKDGSYFKKKIKTIIVTNAKFTSELVKYADCNGIDLLGWNYPRIKSLEQIIEKKDLYPLTILPSFKKYLKQIFAQKGIMLVKDLLEDSPENIAKLFKVPQKEIDLLVREASILFERYED